MTARLRSEAGFTLIELLVGMVILAIGVFGLVASFDSSRKLGDTTEHEDVASQVADRELDTALALPFNAVALTSKPTATATAADDATRWNSVYPTVVPAVSGGNSCGPAINEALPDDESNAGCLVVCPSSATPNTVGCTDATAGVRGDISPIGTVSVPAANATLVQLKVYRYVTWVNDVACGMGCPSPCTSSCAGPTPSSIWRGDYKRVTVAVQVVSGATAATGQPGTQFGTGPRKPMVVSAIKRDPTLGKGNSPGEVAGCGTVVAC